MSQTPALPLPGYCVTLAKLPNFYFSGPQFLPPSLLPRFLPFFSLFLSPFSFVSWGCHSCYPLGLWALNKYIFRIPKCLAMIRILFISYHLLYIIITRRSPKSWFSWFLSGPLSTGYPFFCSSSKSLSSHSSSPAPLLGQMGVWVEEDKYFFARLLFI